MFLHGDGVRRYLGAAVLLVASCLVGCASPPRRTAAAETPASGMDDVRLYQIYIGSKGELLDPYTREVVENERLYIDKIFHNITQINSIRQTRGEAPATMTIFIHGGLNTFENATERVRRVRAQMLNDGNYPMFISWDSGFPGNYRDHLFIVRRGLHRPVAGTLTSPIVLLEDLVRSIVHIPVALYNVLFGQRSLHVAYESADERATNNSLKTLRTAQEFRLHESPHNFGHSTLDDALSLNPVKLATAPLIDGFGKGAWNSMLRRSDLVLRKTRDFYGAPIETIEQEQEKKNPLARFHVASTAAAEFFRRWEEYGRTGGSPPTVLIGHSMGTIIANNILAKYPRIRFDDIVYMGAAARLKDIELVVVPYMQANPATRFYNLSLHPDREINEAHYYDVIARGSLLIWIDDTLGDINSFQDRTSGSWYNMVRSANQVFRDENVRRRVHLTRFGVRDGSPQDHGDFGKCPFWREQFWTFTAYRARYVEDLECNAYVKLPVPAGTATPAGPAASSVPQAVGTPLR